MIDIDKWLHDTNILFCHIRKTEFRELIKFPFKIEVQSKDITNLASTTIRSFKSIDVDFNIDRVYVMIIIFNLNRLNDLKSTVLTNTIRHELRHYVIVDECKLAMVDHDLGGNFYTDYNNERTYNVKTRKIIDPIWIRRLQ